MNVSAASSTPVTVQQTRPPAAAPKDADGDNDGTTRAAAAKPAVTTSVKGSFDGYA